MRTTLKTILILSAIFFASCTKEVKEEAQKVTVPITIQATNTVPIAKPIVLDTVDYNRRLLYLSNGDTTGRWPVKTVYPNVNTVLPFSRIVAYYGNLYSKRMGILGELPEDEMLDSLQSEVKKWNYADSTTPAVPALHYIATTAQLEPGKNGKYIMRMPFAQVDKVLGIAKRIDALVFLDIQVAHSTLQDEVPRLNEYLKIPHVHLGIDPEFSMKTGAKPGTKIGSFHADDINFAIEHLAKIVDSNHLPPKVLVVHRFTQNMVQEYKKIKIVPQVQVVMDMDGWGNKPKKTATYRQFIYPEPVHFTGFKIFYKNDTKKVGAERVMRPEEVLALKPKPIYIQYQ